jgi:integrative and conjugative element protein (TIGR02256 family)
MDELFKLTEQVIALVNDHHERFRIVQKSLKSHSEYDSKYDRLELDFEIIGLPQYREIAVHNVEPITLIIGNIDTMPVIKVRDDFPVVSHLNIHEDNVTKSLCYIDVPYEEIKHKMSGRFLLICIQNWFFKTSMNELHHPDQAIEPFFPYVNNVIVRGERRGNQLFKRYCMEEREFGTLLYPCEAGDYYAILHIPLSQDHSNLMHRMPQTLHELLFNFGNRSAIKTWFDFIGLIVKDPRQYSLYFQQTRNKMLACKAIVDVIIPKSRTIGESPESYDFISFVTQHSLREILNDYGFTLKGSVIVKSGREGSDGSNIIIQPYDVHHQNSKLINGLLNDMDADSVSEQIVLVGAGALGSQILDNCLRMGYGDWTLIDNDYFWPHNIARHVLTSKSIGYMKVKALAEYSATIQTDSAVKVISDDVFGHSDAVNKAIYNANIILDVSASVAVERHIALDVDSNARCASFFLNPAGTATVMLLGGTDGKSRLDLLEMQYYRELISNEKYFNHMALPRTMVYSGSCRSITSRVSQDNVSLSAALCSKALKMYLSNEDGKIIIWTHDGDSVSRVIFDADRWTSQKIGIWTVEVSVPLLAEIKDDRAKFLPRETGGVLVGAYDLARKRLYIVCQIKAPADSVHYPTSFIRGCEHLPERLEEINKATFDNLTYIGEWHSHPNNSTQQSGDDKELYSTIIAHNQENCLPGCMMIVGSTSYSLYVDE